jgi:sarcosine oxidase
VHVAVVGGGVIGLLTAVECVLAGAEVTVVDQHDLPHPGSTSHDRHKMLRAVHPGNPDATRATVRAHQRWLELERLLSSRFYDRVGALTVLPDAELPDALSALWNADTQATALRPAELARRYPDLRLPQAACAVLERDAGALLADRVLAACVGWLRWQPGVALAAHRPVARVDGDAGVLHFADGGTLTADRVVVAAGPWSRALLPGSAAAALTLVRQTMLLCRVPEERRDAWAATPVIPSFGLPSGAWLVPPVAGTPLKLSAAAVCRPVAELGDGVSPRDQRELLLDVFAGLLPGFHEGWVTGARECYYLADTGTGGARVVPLGERALAYAACGGGSFKLAPVIAAGLAGRLTGAPPVRTGLTALDDPALDLPVAGRVVVPQPPAADGPPAALPDAVRG